jgi:thiol-disulfide isomerase/thioredoxin
MDELTFISSMHPYDSPSSLTIWCLCAEWCVICREFKSTFLNLQSVHPKHQWRWIEIEDHDEALSDIDIQGFPSVVIASSKSQWCFAGTIEPRTDTLLRIVRASLAGELRLTAADEKQWEVLLGL